MKLNANDGVYCLARLRRVCAERISIHSLRHFTKCIQSGGMFTRQSARNRTESAAKTSKCKSIDAELMDFKRCNITFNQN